jgi:hypothetical protein
VWITCEEKLTVKFTTPERVDVAKNSVARKNYGSDFWERKSTKCNTNRCTYFFNLIYNYCKL